MAIPSLPSYSLPRPQDFPASKVTWAFDPARAVLLIHDMQDYFARFYGEDSPLIGRVVETIATLRAACKAQGVPVVYTAQPNHQHPQDRGLLNDMWGPGLNQHPELQAVVPPLTPEADDTVLVKWRYSAFQRSPLEQMMKDWGRDQLVICGIYGHIGCLTTALDAFMRDIQPFMVGDAIADFSLDDHLMALKYVAGRCGKVVAAAELTARRDELSRDGLKARLLATLGIAEDEFDADEDLINYGLDSVTTMAMVTEWNQQGIAVSFVELARTTTLNGWWALIERKRMGAAA